VEPEPTDPQATAIQSVLDNWAAAIQQGNVEAAVRCYAQHVKNYLGRKNTSPSRVRARLQFQRGRYGKLAVNRISNMSIIPRGRDFADASFVRHWQSNAAGSGSSGEVEERLTLVRTEVGWKIASEQERPVY
jgi:ketosteroid isomerase-like protein